MILQNPARIFNSHLVNKQENNDFHCLSYFHPGDDRAASDNPFGTLGVFKEVTLAPLKNLLLTLEANELMILFPLSGSLSVEVHDGKPYNIEPEQLLTCLYPKKQAVTISNSEQKQSSSYLYIQVSGISFPKDGTAVHPCYIPQRNMVSTLLEQPGVQLSMGVFDGRQKGEYQLQETADGIFAFVLNGAFEVQDRLLENRDGLALWDISTIDFEALSENAVVLFLGI